MHCRICLFAALSAVAVPSHAASLPLGPSETRAGAFVGAQVRLSLGRRDAPKPSVSLGIAPTHSRVTSEGMVKTRIGDGLALNLAGKKPTITLAGRPAKAALGFERIDGRHEDTKLGISTGGWVAIGAGIVAAAAVGFALWVDEIDDHSD